MWTDEEKSKWLPDNGFPRYGGTVTKDYYPQVYGDPNDRSRDTFNHQYCEHEKGYCLHAQLGSFGTAKISNSENVKNDIISNYSEVGNNVVNPSTGKKVASSDLADMAVGQITGRPAKTTNDLFPVIAIAIGAVVIFNSINSR